MKNFFSISLLIIIAAFSFKPNLYFSSSVPLSMISDEISIISESEILPEEFPCESESNEKESQNSQKSDYSEDDLFSFHLNQYFYCDFSSVNKNSNYTFYLPTFLENLTPPPESFVI